MTASRPAKDWFDRLPQGRMLAEVSLWSADLGQLEADLLRVADGTDMFHIDVADGHFAPAMLFFPDLVARLRRVTAVPFHVHLMTADNVLLHQIEQFAEAGADLISVHAENSNAASAMAAIQGMGLKAGLVLKIDTAVERAKPFLPALDMLTLLGTRIGVKGQSLADDAPARMRQARALITAGVSGRRVLLGADGGIRDNTVPVLRRATADTVVMGSLAFAAPDYAERIAWLHSL
jgi:ribulose-phosphate 3-epimerase